MSANYGSNDSASVNDISRISAGSVIKGEITSPNDIRIDGTFEGRIFSQAKVVVGEKAVIKGDVICNNADFWGKINGNFFVKDTRLSRTPAWLRATSTSAGFRLSWMPSLTVTAR